VLARAPRRPCPTRWSCRSRRTPGSTRGCSSPSRPADLRACGGAARRAGARRGRVGRLAAVLAGLRAAAGVAADEGVPHPAGRRRVPRRGQVRAAGPGRQRGPRARAAVRVAGSGGAGASSSTTGRVPSSRSRSATVPPDVVLAPSRSARRAPRARAGRRCGGADRHLGPFDERVFNPIGFEPLVDGPVVTLASLRGRAALRGAGPVAASAAGVDRSHPRVRAGRLRSWPVLSDGRRPGRAARMPR
jgi:hypothetical protein